MAYGTAPTGFASDGGTSWPSRIALVVAASALALGTAVWIAEVDPVLPISWPVSLADGATASFGDRFWQAATPDASSTEASAVPDVQSESAERKMLLERAEAILASKLLFRAARAALIDEPRNEPKPTIVAAIPLPRSRPVEMAPEALNQPAVVQPQDLQPHDRSLLQKLSDLLPPRLTLASLAPDGGLFRGRPSLASLGYDNLTAVYDISARAVYMPDGSTLEAHSGLGSLMDDPAYVGERNAGATPPNVYELKPRETLFHGVQALRMMPVGEQDTLGRSGLLAHSYMLGPNGDSNGCVSIRDYETFLAAFTRGEIKRLVVVPKLGDEAPASRRST